MHTYMQGCLSQNINTLQYYRDIYYKVATCDAIKFANSFRVILLLLSQNQFKLMEATSECFRYITTIGFVKS